MTVALHRPSPLRAVPALGLATACGLAAGAGTIWLQSQVSLEWSLAADSGAVWTLIAFAVAALCSGPRALAVAAGALALVAEVIGYYAVGTPSPTALAGSREVQFWGLAAVVIGPLAGLAGHAARRGTPAQAVSALVAMAGVLVGEAWFLIGHGGGSTAARAELVAGLVLATVSLVAVRASAGARVAALAVGLLAAAATVAAYGSPPQL